MKKSIATAFLIFLINNAFSQTFPNSFSVLNNKIPDKEAFYKKSIEAADMEQFRARDIRVKLIFDTGFEIELLSAKELYLKGVNLNPNTYIISYPDGYTTPVFTVLPDGRLTAKVSNDSKNNANKK